MAINHRGEIVSCILSPGNVDDKNPVPKLTKDMFGKIYGNKEYISKKLFERFYKQDLQLITRLKSKIKNMLMNVVDKGLLYQRSLIETVINKLKTQRQIEHHRLKIDTSLYGQFTHMSCCIFS